MEKYSALLDTTIFTLLDHAFTLGQLLIVPSFIFFGWLITRWIAAIIANRLASRNVQPDVVHLVQRLFYVVAIVVLIITTLDLINVPLTAFAFVSGAVAIGFGFGAQNIINNFISGWILMWERPIRIGDFLEVDDAKGRVESINTRSTRIRRADGVHMLIPNSKLLENTVINWTLVDRVARTSVRLGVAYGSDVKKVAELLQQATSEQPEILEDPDVQVVFDDFGDNALIFESFFWVHASGDRELRVIRSNIRFRVEDLFNANNIVIAFPQRDIHIDGSLTLQPRIRTKDN